MATTTGTRPRTRSALYADGLQAVLGDRWFAVGVGGCSAAVAAFLLARLQAWPPHEDETLALFVGRNSLGGLWTVVTQERGGAPLHFMVAWVVEHLGGGLTALRLASATFAVVSIPVIAALSARLAGRRTALVATVLASGSWLVLFHGVYGRMYSLFLLASAASFLALLRAVERGTRERWAVWGLAALVTISVHPYGALVFGSQALFLIARARTRIALWTCSIVVLAATPFWFADLVLAGRFDVGVGQGQSRLPGPVSVAQYLWAFAGDASSGFPFVLAPVLLVAAYGAWMLRRRQPEAALLTASVVGVPLVALVAVHLGDTASPETRHLVFVLPFFATLVAAGLVPLLRRPAALAVGVALLLTAEVGWAWYRTPPLFTGEPSWRAEARDAASSWLVATARRDDVLLGYDPVFLDAWQRDRSFPRTVVPRADAKLASQVLTRARPLGRGVWVLDAGGSADLLSRTTIPYRLPSPASAFEARRFGPFLVVRSRDATREPLRYVALAESVMRLGVGFDVPAAEVNLATLRRTEQRLR